MASRRNFLQVSAAGLALGLRATKALAARESIEEASLSRLQQMMTSGEWTSLALTKAYLARIAETNSRGHSLRAILETNPEAEAIATALDAERKAKGPRGPLHGIPLVVKDNLETADRMATTAGSLALMGVPVPGDAPVVKRLREARAVILAKSNLSEWANIRSTRSTSGWSARGGLTLNPYCLDRTPSGSSSGSAVAAAANLCGAAVGTETNGSIIAPSSANALVGLKPTVGLCSRTGIIPISASQDTPGPMARSVMDVALLLNAMAGPDPSDPSTQAPGRVQAKEYAQGLSPDGLKGLRLGVARKLFGTVEPVNQLMEKALADLTRLGAELIEVDLGSGVDDATQLQVLLYELKDGMARYLANRRGSSPLKNLADLIAFNEKEKAREMPLFGQELFVQAQAKGPLTTPEYLQARETCLKQTRAAGIDWAIGEHRLDALVTVAMGPPPMVDLVYGEANVPYGAGMAAVAGYPSLTVPMGQMWGLPTGILFFGSAWSEATLLKAGFAYEQATHHRQPPAFRATARTE